MLHFCFLRFLLDSPYFEETDTKDHDSRKFWPLDFPFMRPGLRWKQGCILFISLNSINNYISLQLFNISENIPVKITSHYSSDCTFAIIKNSNSITRNEKHEYSWKYGSYILILTNICPCIPTDDCTCCVQNSLIAFLPLCEKSFHDQVILMQTTSWHQQILTRPHYHGVLVVSVNKVDRMDTLFPVSLITMMKSHNLIRCQRHSGRIRKLIILIRITKSCSPHHTRLEGNHLKWERTLKKAITKSPILYCVNQTVIWGNVSSYEYV